VRVVAALLESKSGHRFGGGEANGMTRRLFGQILCMALALNASAQNDFASRAAALRDDLTISTYVTVETTRKLAESADLRQQSLDVLAALGVAKVYFETTRGCPVPPEDQLAEMNAFYRTHGIATAAGLATHPGQEGFGVRADRGLAWFNYQAADTQRVLAEAVAASARVFDEVIIDDFLCSGDMSAESDAARGSRDWGTYRRDLLTGLSTSMILEPARAARPDVTVIIKFPQWYDLFHVFGYDPERQSQLFDKVYIGTETRGPYTQRFGFTQPTEAFINFRWLSAIAGDKTGGAWFDHADCNGEEFVDQAWQSVLAGARELILFSYPALVDGHPGHEPFRRDFEALAGLARTVRDHPVVGIPAYKPPNSPPGGDMYLMDHLGMLALPVVPTPRFPSASSVILLPTQAATDPGLTEKLTEFFKKPGRTAVLTTGLLATAKDGEALSRLAGVAWPRDAMPLRVNEIKVGEGTHAIEKGLDLGGNLHTTGARVLLEALHDGETVPFLTEFEQDGRRLLVLNAQTYTQADFDAVGEHLLSPRDLGLLDLPQVWCDVLRNALAGALEKNLSAPARVSAAWLADGSCVVQNHGRSPALVTFPGAVSMKSAIDLSAGNTSIVLESARELAPHARRWFKRAERSLP